MQCNFHVITLVPTLCYSSGAHYLRECITYKIQKEEYRFKIFLPSH